MGPEMIFICRQYPQINNTHSQTECRAGRENDVDRFFCRSFPKNGEQKNNSQWWCNKSKHRLKHIKKIQSFNVVDGQRHHHSKYTTCNNREATGPDNIFVTCME